ncbi:hypothetical protein ANCCAN_03871 [Ancylostoma caninum]|uniref:Uncharacterized protein n=1 Tax=Ancylostoma caninum TaxID=29170 RepID=A0A368H095_ANCCA|nr:hypothetical protein ANCCAN_03871 [Ancylostoma caninum]
MSKHFAMLQKSLTRFCLLFRRDRSQGCPLVTAEGNLTNFSTKAKSTGADPLKKKQNIENANEITAIKRGRLLNLIGLNSRFTDPFRQRMIKKKIRSVRMDDDHLYDD